MFFKLKPNRLRVILGQLKEYKENLAQSKAQRFQKDLKRWSYAKVYPYASPDYTSSTKTDYNSDASEDSNSSGSSSGSTELAPGDLWECFIRTSKSNLSTDDESDNTREKESHICAVCLDVFFNPYMCYPCHHIFCEPCLRTLAKDNPSSTPCPLCRTTIAKVLFQTALNKSTIACFPNEYFKRKHSFQRTSCARWPLPCCKKVFRVFGGLAKTTRGRQFPHSTHRLDSTDFEDNNHGWRSDVDMMIIYIFSVNWVLGFLIFCFLCYFFFPSF
ncbi:E3 ubiquitin-protein ligase RNF180 [Lissotriton helveticus]